MNCVMYQTLGKCIACQAGATFFSISASSLTSKWVQCDNNFDCGFTFLFILYVFGRLEREKRW